MDPIRLLEKYGRDNPVFLEVILRHSKVVAQKALKIAEKFREADKDFIYEAAMLHDIGAFFTYFPELNPKAEKPYILHGCIGREILEREGYPKHALVCERHIGVGITKEEIISKKLPLPLRDMVPETLEEKIIAFADKFFSKIPERLDQEKSIEEIKSELAKHGEEKARIFEEWVRVFT